MKGSTTNYPGRDEGPFSDQNGRGFYNINVRINIQPKVAAIERVIEDRKTLNGSRHSLSE